MNDNSLDALQSSIETKIVVLVDEREESRPSKWKVSSIPLLQRLKLENMSFYFVSASQSIPSLSLQEWIDISSPHTALLYPSDASIPLDVSHSRFSTGEDVHNPNAVHTLVVLDGSWRSVQQLLHHNPLLHPRKLRHVRLDMTSSCTSYYQRLGLRVEPAPSCVSTAEAIARALFLLEKPTSQISNVILEDFRKFVESNVAMLRKAPISDDGMELNDAKRLISAESVKDTFSIHELNESRIDGDGKETQDCGHEEIINCKRYFQEFDDADQNYLLPSRGVKEKKAVSKAEKRKHNREKERRRKKNR